MEHDDDHRSLLQELFGDSSSGGESDDGDGDGNSRGDLRPAVDPVLLERGEGSLRLPRRSPNWERVGGINGLWLCQDFLSHDRQSYLLSAIKAEGWFAEASHNQAMRFGDLPGWATDLSFSIREMLHLSDIVPELDDLGTCEADKDLSDILWRDPLFDQLIVNVYQPGEGICAHVDLMRFDDGIAIVSLESPCVMHFSRVDEETCKTVEGKDDLPKIKRFPVYLAPGSLAWMWGEARYLWKHEINRKPGFQVWDGWEICQRKRTSITLRKLCGTE